MVHKAPLAQAPVYLLSLTVSQAPLSLSALQVQRPFPGPSEALGFILPQGLCRSSFCVESLALHPTPPPTPALGSAIAFREGLPRPPGLRHSHLAPELSLQVMITIARVYLFVLFFC